MNLRDADDADWRTELRLEGDDAVIRQIDAHTGDEDWEMTITANPDGCYLLGMGGCRDRLTCHTPHL